MQWTDWIGYAGSALIAGSLLMSNIWKLRWINLAGALLFIVYGFCLRSQPVFLLNLFIAGADLYWLYRISLRRNSFSLLRLAPDRSEFRDKFLDYYRTDIARFFPEFDWSRLNQPQSILVLRNLLPVGLFVYETQPVGTVNIAMDYVIPDYRDLKNARFFYAANQTVLREQGFRSFVAQSSVKTHQRYLRKLGFTRENAGSNSYRKSI